MSAEPATVGDESLLWVPFHPLLSEADRILVEDGSHPQIADRIENITLKLLPCMDWISSAVKRFKPPNQNSRAILERSSQVKLGQHTLSVDKELLYLTFTASHLLNLDEIQAYILVSRLSEKVDAASRLDDDFFLSSALNDYFLERQSLLKFVQTAIALKEHSQVKEGTKNLLTQAMASIDPLNILTEALTSRVPQHMDLRFAEIWAEELCYELAMALDLSLVLYRDSEKTPRDLAPCLEALSGTLFSTGTLPGTVSQALGFNSKTKRLVVECRQRANLLLASMMNLDTVCFASADGTVSLGDLLNSIPYTAVARLEAAIAALDPSDRDHSPLFLAWGVFLIIASSIELDTARKALLSNGKKFLKTAQVNGALEYLASALDSAFLSHNGSLFRGTVKVLAASYLVACSLPSGAVLNSVSVVPLLCKLFHGRREESQGFWDESQALNGHFRKLLLHLADRAMSHNDSLALLQLLSAVSTGFQAASKSYDFLLQRKKCPTGEEDSQLSSAPDEIYLLVKILLCSKQHSNQLMASSQLDTALLAQTQATLSLIQALTDSSGEITKNLLLLDSSTAVRHAKAHGFISESHRWDTVEFVGWLAISAAKFPSGLAAVSAAMQILARFAEIVPSEVAEMLNVEGRPCSHGRQADIRSHSLGNVILSVQKEEQKQEEHPLACSLLDLASTLAMAPPWSVPLTDPLVLFCVQKILPAYEGWSYRSMDDKWRMEEKALGLAAALLSEHSWTERAEGGQLYDSSLVLLLLKVLLEASSTVQSTASSAALASCHRTIAKGLEVLSRLLLSASGVQQVVVHLPIVGASNLLASIHFLTTYRTSAAVQASALLTLTHLVNQSTNVQLATCLQLEQHFAWLGNSAPFKHSLASLLSVGPTSSRPSLLTAALKFLEAASQLQPELLRNLLAPMAHNGGSSPAPGCPTGDRPLLDALWAPVEKVEWMLQNDLATLAHVLKLLSALWERRALFGDSLDQLCTRGDFWARLMPILLTPIPSLMIAQAKECNLGVPSSMASLAHRLQCELQVLRMAALSVFDHPSTRQGAFLLLAGEWGQPSKFATFLGRYTGTFCNLQLVAKSRLYHLFLYALLLLKVSLGETSGMSASVLDSLSKTKDELLAHPSAKVLLSQQGSRESVLLQILNVILDRIHGREGSGASDHLVDLANALSTMPNHPIFHTFQPDSLEGLSLALGVERWTESRSPWCSAQAVHTVLLTLQHISWLQDCARCQLEAMDHSCTLLTALLFDSHGEVRQEGRLLFAPDNIQDAIGTFHSAMSALDEPDSCAESRSVLNAHATFLCHITQLAAQAWTTAKGLQPGTEPAGVTAQVVDFGVRAILRHRTIAGYLDPIEHSFLIPTLNTLLQVYAVQLSTVPESSDVVHHESLATVLPILCLSTAVEPYADVSISVVNVILQMLPTESWLPILEKYLPIVAVLAAMARTTSFDSVHNFLSLAMTMARTPAGAGLLLPRGIFSFLLHCLMAAPAGPGADSDPKLNSCFVIAWKLPVFTASEVRQLRGSVLRLATALLQTLGQSEACALLLSQHTSGFFAMLEKCILPLLQVPTKEQMAGMEAMASHHYSMVLVHQNRLRVFVDLDGLTELRDAALLLSTAARHASDIGTVSLHLQAFVQPVIRLLGFISREGSKGRARVPFFEAAPKTAAERSMAAAPGQILTVEGWFGAFCAQEEAGNSFFERLAAMVYEVCHIALEFLCSLIQSSVKSDLGADMGAYYKMPPLPSPVVLQGLQAQVSRVIETMKSGRFDTGTAAVQGSVAALLGIMEKSLFLESVVARAQGGEASRERIHGLNKSIKALEPAVKVLASAAHLSLIESAAQPLLRL